MKLTVLASGSKANAAVLTAGACNVLIDAGLSATQIVSRLEAAGIEPMTINACLVTHEHKDHTAGLEKFCAGWNVPVYANALTASSINSKKIDFRLFKNGSGFLLPTDDLHVETYRVQHDAVDPCGFILTDTHTGDALAFATDLGVVEGDVLERWQRASSIFLEANYCDDLIAADTSRPWSVRERIKSPNGHLSNEQAAQAIRAVPGLRKAILGHMSASTNNPGRATATVLKAVHEETELTDIECAFRLESERLQPPQQFDIL